MPARHQQQSQSVAAEGKKQLGRQGEVAVGCCQRVLGRLHAIPSPLPCPALRPCLPPALLCLPACSVDALMECEHTAAVCSRVRGMLDTRVLVRSKWRMDRKRRRGSEAGRESEGSRGLSTGGARQFTT